MDRHTQAGARTRCVTLGALLMAAMLTPSGAMGPAVAEAGDGSVRFLTAGPVRLAPGGAALARLWLPAGQRGARLTYLGDGGQVLGQVDVEAPAQAGAFFEVVVEVHYDGKLLDITDGTSNTILHDGSQGIIAILIGLLAPAPQGRSAMPRGPMATLEVQGSPGQARMILPFVEQDN